MIELRVSSGEYICALTLKKRITYIRGDSGQGKTSLLNVLEAYRNDDPDVRVELNCNRSLYPLVRIARVENLDGFSNSIVFLDDSLAIENEEFGTVRTVVIDGEVWFVGKDVAKALGYKNTMDALARHVDAEDKIQRDDIGILDAMGRGQRQTLINEPGLYSLVISSKLQTAKQFKWWVTHEVIPSIRKDGFYSSGCGSIESQILKCVQDNIVPAVKTLEVVAPCVADLCKRVDALEQKANAPQKSLEDSVIDLSGLDAKQWKEYQTRNLKMIAYSQDMRDKDVLSSMYKEIEFTNDISLRKVIEHCRGGVFAGISQNSKLREMFDSVMNARLKKYDLRPSKMPVCIDDDLTDSKD